MATGPEGKVGCSAGAAAAAGGEAGRMAAPVTVAPPVFPVVVCCGAGVGGPEIVIVLPFCGFPTIAKRSGGPATKVTRLVGDDVTVRLRDAGRDRVITLPLGIALSPDLPKVSLISPDNVDANTFRSVSVLVTV